MLKMFRTKNFNSFKDEVVLDMRAVSYKDMQGHVIGENDNKVVKTLAIYGKNASGKSNLIAAIYYFKSFVFNQFFDAGDRSSGIDLGNRMQVSNRQPFMLDKDVNDETEFEIIFCHNKRTYQYGFVIKDNFEKNGYEIKEEWLLVDDKKVYDRDAEGITYGKSYAKEIKKITLNRQDRLYIGILDYFADGSIKEIVDEFKYYLTSKFEIYFQIGLEGSVKGIVADVSFTKRIVEDEYYKDLVEKFMRIADVGVVGISIEETKSDNIMEKITMPYVIKTIHNVYDEQDNVIRQEKFLMQDESSGTNRYFIFIQNVINIIERGGVFFVDEISSKLHPMLTKFIVDLFHGKKNKNAQLIFTTHDIYLMNRKYFRRDEIGFVEKNRRGESSLFTLADIKTRSDASFAKDYMNGKYGAIPKIDEDSLASEMVGEWVCQD